MRTTRKPDAPVDPTAELEFDLARTNAKIARKKRRLTDPLSISDFVNLNAALDANQQKKKEIERKLKPT